MPPLNKFFEKSFMRKGRDGEKKWKNKLGLSCAKLRPVSLLRFLLLENFELCKFAKLELGLGLSLAILLCLCAMQVNIDYIICTAPPSLITVGLVDIRYQYQIPVISVYQTYHSTAYNKLGLSCAKLRSA